MCKFFLFLFLILINFFLISCKCKNNYLNTSLTFNTWKRHQENLSKIVYYQARGFLIFSFFDKKKIHLRFVFQKVDNNHWKLIFTNPMTFSSIEIHVLEDNECCTYSKMKNCFSVCDFERMIKKFTNITFPFKNFQNWILGLPGTACNFNLTEQGYLKILNDQYNDQILKILYESYYNNMIPILPKVMKIYCNKNCYCNIKIYNWIVS